MDWFERLTGFRETDYDDTRAKLRVNGNRLRSLVAGFWSEVQRVYENRICTSLPSSLRIAWNGVLTSSGGVKRRVPPAGQPIARQFARDRRLRTADRPSDGADRMAQDLQQTNLFSLVI